MCGWCPENPEAELLNYLYNLCCFDAITNLSRLKGEVRTINDRNICERGSYMKNNGKSPTFKFVSGEERRPSEVQRVSRNCRLPGAMHSSADSPGSEMTGNSDSGAVRAGKRRAWAWELLFRLRQIIIEWDMSDSEETIWDPISSLGRVMPPSDFVLDSSRSSFSQTKKNWPDILYHVPQYHKP